MAPLGLFTGLLSVYGFCVLAFTALESQTLFHHSTKGHASLTAVTAHLKAVTAPVKVVTGDEHSKDGSWMLGLYNICKHSFF